MNVEITQDKSCSTYWHVRADSNLVGNIAGYRDTWKFSWGWMKRDAYTACQLAEITAAAKGQEYLLNLTRRLLA
jgi:hypothetical protein